MGKRRNFRRGGRHGNKYKGIDPAVRYIFLIIFVPLFIYFLVTHTWSKCVWEWPLEIFNKSCYVEQFKKSVNKTIEKTSEIVSGRKVPKVKVKQKNTKHQ